MTDQQPPATSEPDDLKTDLDRLIEDLLASSEPTRDPTDDQIAVLENEVQETRNKHFEERFLWFLAVLVLFNSLIFLSMENWSAPVVIGILELIAVLIMADRCKVDAVAPLIDKVTGAFGSLRR